MCMYVRERNTPQLCIRDNCLSANHKPHLIILGKQSPGTHTYTQFANHTSDSFGQQEAAAVAQLLGLHYQNLYEKALTKTVNGLASATPKRKTVQN